VGGQRALPAKQNEAASHSADTRVAVNADVPVHVAVHATPPEVRLDGGSAPSVPSPKPALPARIADERAQTNTSSKTSRRTPDIDQSELSKLSLHADMKCFGEMISNETLVFYDQESGLTAADYRRLVNTPAVEKRKAEWEQWYTTIFDALRPREGQRIPQGVRTKINVLVDSNRHIIATREWMDPTTESAAIDYVENMLSSLKALDGTSTLQFPASSTAEAVTFFFEISSANNGDFRLVVLRQPLN
jgi:hypothetical protein